MAKGGAENLLYSGIPQGIIAGCIGLLFTGLLQLRGDLPSGLLITFAGALVAGTLAAVINRVLLASGERAATAIYAPSGASTAYTPTFSHIQSMEIRGDLDAPAHAWEEAGAEAPTDVFIVVKAADFHLRARQDFHAAHERYLRARALGTGPDDLRRYVAQKLVDLYLGPLADEGRAMSELRRLIDGFPGTLEAEAARRTLAELKVKRSTPPEGTPPAPPPTA